ncbi:MAG: thioredoxin family protein [Actinomycetota bacterium]|nr:thioredoxin family protein [Actinomycetota bacterium]
MGVTDLTSTRPHLPDGLVAFVKRDCPTCVDVASVLGEICARGPGVVVYTQDDPSFPEAVESKHHDHDLKLSWHYDVETVPTLMYMQDGTEMARTVGWSRTDWEALTGVEDLGVELPEMRPGCGSLSVDPSLSEGLAIKFGETTMHSRRVEFASLEDEFEAMFDRGWSDGLPIVPPTEERVARMLTGTDRQPEEFVAIIPPALVDCTVEKVAINAVMAGCRPD